MAGSAVPEVSGPPTSQPRYLWIRESLLRRIVDGKLKRGDPIESEVQMARSYGVSLGTVRKAVDELVAQNVLERRQGKGTFVAPRDGSSRLLFDLVGANDERELPAFKELLKLNVRAGTAGEIGHLQLASNANIIDMLRTRAFADGTIIVERVVLPGKLFPSFEKRMGDRRPTVLYEFYEEEFGVSIMDFEERVRAVLASQQDARLIGCDVGAALLEIERTAYGFDDRPVELRFSRSRTNTRHYYRPRR